MQVRAILEKKTYSLSRKNFLQRQSEHIIKVKGQNNFWQQNVFLTCYWRFPRSNKLEQLELKLEKIIGIQKHAGKVTVQINCSSDLKIFANYRPSASNFTRFSRSLEQFFSHGLNNFGNKIPNLIFNQPGFASRLASSSAARSTL